MYRVVMSLAQVATGTANPAPNPSHAAASRPPKPCITLFFIVYLCCRSYLLFVALDRGLCHSLAKLPEKLLSSFSVHKPSHLCLPTTRS